MNKYQCLKWFANAPSPDGDGYVQVGPFQNASEEARWIMARAHEARMAGASTFRVVAGARHRWLTVRGAAASSTPVRCDGYRTGDHIIEFRWAPIGGPLRCEPMSAGDWGNTERIERSAGDYNHCY